MLDLDGFKHVNDEQGHLRGDMLLKEIPRRPSSRARADSNVVARYGGDEFLLVLPDTDANRAHVVADCVVQSVHDVGARFIRRARSRRASAWPPRTPTTPSRRSSGAPTRARTARKKKGGDGVTLSA